MTTTRLRRHDLTVAMAFFNSAAATVAGLYSSTRSIAVTLIGTSGSVVMIGWLMWLSRRPDDRLVEREPMTEGSRAGGNRAASATETAPQERCARPLQAELPAHR